MIKRIFAVMAVLAMLGTAPALAQYDNNDDVATVEDATVEQGGTTTVTGCGFKGESTVTLKLVDGDTTTTLGDGTADGTGCVSIDGTIPTEVLGVVIMRLEGVDASDNARVLDTTITVVDDLAATGTDSGGLSTTGLMLVAAGGLLVLGASRYRRNDVKETVGS